MAENTIPGSTVRGESLTNAQEEQNKRMMAEIMGQMRENPIHVQAARGNRIAELTRLHKGVGSRHPNAMKLKTQYKSEQGNLMQKPYIGGSEETICQGANCHNYTVSDVTCPSCTEAESQPKSAKIVGTGTRSAGKKVK